MSAPSPQTGRPAPVPSGSTARKRDNINSPNALTVLRILLVPLFGWFLLRDGGHVEEWRWWAAGTFALAMATDKVDGSIARRRNLITDFGKLADPVADKAMTGMAFIGLSVLGAVWWWATVLVLARELGITAMRMWLKRFAVLPAGKGGKLKTVLQTIGLLMVVMPIGGWFHLVGLVVVGAAVAVTVLTGIDYAWQGWKVYQASKGAGAGARR